MLASHAAPKSLYRPLTGTEVRLLTIHPVQITSFAPGRRDLRVRCELAHYRLHEPSDSTKLREYLDEFGEYWDSSGADLEVRIAGHTTPALRDLSDRFGRMRLSRRTHPEIEGRYSWGDYVALSYTWGDPKNTREIFVNDQSMQVTTNLEAALRALRNKAPIKAGLKVWIDAICLNQADKAEKDVQIKRMRDIYRQSFDVVIWLGSAFQDSDKAIRLVFLLSASFKDDQGAALQQFVDDDQNHLDKILGPGVESLVGCWHALRLLMRNQYWNRAWIVQELFFSRRDSPVLCGSDYVELGDLSDATTRWINPDSLGIVRRQMYGERLLLAADGRPMNTLGRAPRTALERAAAKYGGVMFDPEIQSLKGTTEAADVQNWTIDSQRLHFISRLKLSLNGESTAHPANLIALGRDSEATDARDKIFAFTGLMDPDFAKLIDAGYTSTIEDVYAAFSITWMKNAKTLDLLTHCRLEDYPESYTGRTWVPNWRNQVSQPLLFIGDVPKPYNAGGESGPHLLSSNRRILTVAGTIVSRIDGASATEDETSSKVAQPQKVANIYKPGSDERIRDAIWRTFLGNRDFDFDIPTVANVVPGFDEGWRALIDIPLPKRGGHLPAPFDKSFYEFIEINADFKINGKCLTSYFANGGRREPIMTDAASVRIMKNALLDSVMRASLMTHRRRLITTTNGHIGLVPRAARPGDAIAVLLGCREPIVLREGRSQGKQRWKVVGPCYVHGIMEGEVIREVAAERVELQEIDLC